MKYRAYIVILFLLLLKFNHAYGNTSFILNSGTVNQHARHHAGIAFLPADLTDSSDGDISFFNSCSGNGISVPGPRNNREKSLPQQSCVFDEFKGHLQFQQVDLPPPLCLHNLDCCML